MWRRASGGQFRYPHEVQESLIKCSWLQFFMKDHERSEVHESRGSTRVRGALVPAEEAQGQQEAQRAPRREHSDLGKR